MVFWYEYMKHINFIVPKMSSYNNKKNTSYTPLNKVYDKEY